MLIVTAAIIMKDGKVLLAQRRPDAHMALKWEFPGGKLEEEESPEECLQREIAEELDIDIEVGEIYKVVMHRYEEKTILLLAYLCKHRSGEVKALDCNAFRWVDVSGMDDFDYPPADLPIVEKLKREMNLLDKVNL